MEREECVLILKALSDETRLQIFKMLDGVNLCGYKILEKFNITQPTLSHHLKILCDSGIVKAEKDWKWTYYSQNTSKFQEFLSYIKSLNDKYL